MKQQHNHIEHHHRLIEQLKHSSFKLGMTTLFVIFGLFGLWSVFAPIETTITAEGKVISRSYNKTIKHPTGGIVSRLYVKEGDTVKKGDPLVRLDDTSVRAQYDASIKRYDRNLFALCRLRAEAEESSRLACDTIRRKLYDASAYDTLLEEARLLFRSDMHKKRAKLALLKSKNTILHTQNEGLKHQIASNEALLHSYEKELSKWEKLLKADAVDELKAIETERAILQTKQQIAALKSQIEQNLASIDANDKQIALEREKIRNDILNNEDRLRTQNITLRHTIDSLKNTLTHTTLVAPDSGHVIAMKIHAPGEVLSPQEPVMTIVPDKNNIRIEAYIAPTDIEKVHVGQAAEILFPSFVDPAAVPITGKIAYLSADTLTAPDGKRSYYRALVDLTPQGMNAITHNGFTIVPGMPATVLVKTGKKTLMQYLLQPISQMWKGIYHAN